MNIGTKSLLFGVHQFLWHPLSIGLAWRKCYNVWPKWYEWVAIFCHDLGYWGKPNMDGPEGRTHPERGAELAGSIAMWIGRKFHDYDTALVIALNTHWLSLCHSTHYAQAAGQPNSKLYLPDKVSILFEPRWWYLLRSKLSGEVYEYARNAPGNMTPTEWFGWYRERVSKKLESFKQQEV